MTVKCTMVLGDCLEVMAALPEAGAQMCFADFPYACTQSRWDASISLGDFWPAWRKLAAPKWTMAATATFRFATELYNSAPKLFRYDLVFNKLLCSGFLQAKHAPMRYHENILIFGEGRGIYNPQREKRKPGGFRGDHKQCGGQHDTWSLINRPKTYAYTDTILPRSVLPVMGEAKCLLTHSAQKPTALLDWLIRTYSNPGDNVLDPVSGSGTTAVSAVQNGRSVTCIEKDQGYFEASVERVKKHVKDNNLDVKIEVRR